MRINLKNLPEASAQEVFDQVKGHLLQQGVRSMVRNPDHQEGCVYRGPSGLKCAAGCLIGEDEYDPLWEGKAWFALVESEEVPKEHGALINELQAVHDRISVEGWAMGLRRVAATFKLEWKE